MNDTSCAARSQCYNMRHTHIHTANERECNFGCWIENLYTISYIGVNRSTVPSFTCTLSRNSWPCIAKRINEIAIHSAETHVQLYNELSIPSLWFLIVDAFSTAPELSFSICEINSLWGTWKYTITVQSNVPNLNLATVPAQHFPPKRHTFQFVCVCSGPIWKRRRRKQKRKVWNEK